MEFFNLFVSPEPEVIGVNNGIYQGNIIWEKFSNKESKEKIMSFFSLKKFIENNPIIDPIDFTIEYVGADKKAKMTDFFMFSPALYGISYFVTKKVVDILSMFSLPLSVFIPVNIFQQGIKYEYYALYIAVHYRENAIDFSRSVFCEKLGFEKVKEIVFKDKDEYLKNRFLDVDKIAFNENFDKKLDLFELIWGNGYYISENLKRALEKEKLTGIVIRNPINPQIVT